MPWDGSPEVAHNGKASVVVRIDLRNLTAYDLKCLQDDTIGFLMNGYLDNGKVESLDIQEVPTVPTDA